MMCVLVYEHNKMSATKYSDLVNHFATEHENTLIEHTLKNSHIKTEVLHQHVFQSTFVKTFNSTHLVV